MRGVRTGALTAAAVSLVLLAAGCTGHSSGKPSAKTSSAPAVVDRIRNDINPMPYAKVATGGTLNYPIDAPIANFNKYELDGDNINTATIMATMLPSLFTIDDENRFTYNPDYLTGEPVVATAPAQSMTYQINPKATWSDGTPVSYRDFVTQWEALRGTDAHFSITSPAGYDGIATVARGATDQQVVVTLKSGVINPDWRGLFSPLYPSTATGSATVFNNGWKAKPLTSAGPFMYSTGDASSYTVVRNPHWWGQAAKLDKIVFKIYRTPAMTAAALKAKSVDVQDIGQDPITYALVKALPGLAMRHAGALDVRDVTLNGSRPLLTDVRVRQALALGIDRTAIAKAQLTPLGIPSATAPDNHIFLADQTGYQDNSGSLGAYDPTAAKKLLDQAGWVDNPAKHVRTKAGKTLTLTFVIPAAAPPSDSEAALVKAQLAKIDVQVVVKPVPGTRLFNQYVKPGAYDLTVFSWLGSSFPITDATTIYEPEQPGANWQHNYSRVSLTQVGTLMKQAESSLDATAANTAANQADALIWQNVLSLPIYQRPDIWAANAKLANFGAFGFASVDWTAVGYTSPPA